MLQCLEKKIGECKLLAKTHISGGLCAALLFASMTRLSPIPAVITVAAGMIGGLIPDLDHGKSTITKKTGIIGFFFSRAFKHRGVLHTPIVYLLLCGILVKMLPSAVWLHYLLYGLLCGELSHLFLDMLNPSGIPLLWPITRRKISLLPIQTGGKADYLIGKLCLVGAVLLMVDAMIG